MKQSSAQSSFLENEFSMLQFGAKLACENKAPAIIFLQGDLGAGKTTLTRGFLRELGCKENIKSPSFTIVEPYEFSNFMVYHFDLYRIHDPEELEYIGLSDYLTDDAICLIEWPEHASELLPQPTVSCTIEIPDDGIGRLVTCHK